MSTGNIEDDTLQLELHDGTLHSARGRLTAPGGSVEMHAAGGPDIAEEGVEQLYAYAGILEEVFNGEAASEHTNANGQSEDEPLPAVRRIEDSTTLKENDE
jgi:hypothetical protein